MVHGAACETCRVSWLGAFLDALLGAVGCSLSFGTGCALRPTASFGWAVPIGVAIIAGISLMLGQWALLAINRVGRWRTLLTLATSGLGTLCTGVVEAGLVALLSWALQDRVRLWVVLPAVLVAYAPYWLGFLVVLPYTGPGVARVLKVWHLLAMWLGLRPVLDMGGGYSLLIAAVAWLAQQGIDALIERAPMHLRERVFKLVSGSAGLTGRDLMSSARLGDHR